MEKYAYLLREIFECSAVTQRELAKKLSLSLGSVNTLIKEALSLDYIARSENKLILTASGLDCLSAFKVDRAVIMAVQDLFRLPLKLQRDSWRYLAKG